VQNSSIDISPQSEILQSRGTRKDSSKLLLFPAVNHRWFFFSSNGPANKLFQVRETTLRNGIFRNGIRYQPEEALNLLAAQQRIEGSKVTLRVCLFGIELSGL